MIGQVNRAAGLDLVSPKYEKYQPLGLGIKFRAHPLGVGIARVQLRRLPGLNAGRAGYITAVETGIREIPGLEPIPTSEGSERGGFYGFPTMFHPSQVPGITRQDYIAALRANGIPANESPYDLLHRLPYFAEGMDVFGNGRGSMCGDYPGYREGDFPGAEEMHRGIVFLPVLTDPVDGAADEVLRRIRAAASALGF
jgi:dTDP-4-amino-4,6-dideoxygalactose transaminase